MEVKPLLTASNLSAYYDSDNDWLYLDWHGELTLDRLRNNCLQVVLCFLTKRYKRILNDNTNLTRVSSDVVPWLATEILPYLRLVGVEYMAWVLSPSLDVQNEAEAAIEELTMPVVALFDDMASAYDWLSGVKFKSPVMLQPSSSVAQVMSVIKNRISFLGGN